VRSHSDAATSMSAPELRVRRTLEAREQVFQRIARGAPLPEILDLIARSSEEIIPDVLCSVLLLEPGTRRLKNGAAPSLPDFFSSALQGAETGPGRGSCGTAAYTGTRVIVEDVQTHPYWADWKQLAAAAGLRACWSEPILSARGIVLGTFAMYYREPRRPDPVDLDFIHTSAYVAGVAIERAQAEAELALHRRFADERAGLGELAKHERFVIRERMGAGGMGVVYRALDRTRGGEVAIKVLRHVEGDTLFRFKREFRALADLAHPNLVNLYELMSTGEEWFFTMELLDGVPFTEYLGVESEASPPTTEETTPGSVAHGRVAFPLPPSVPRPRAHGCRSPARLWPALQQLAEGVAALHRAGRLHRDIKPSNVLVTREGRVVLCDFGLVSDVDEVSWQDDSEPRQVAGTPMYMSPEQATGQPLTEATDWYSVGVMLYESLTGRLPFGGDRERILWLKARGEAAPPSSFAPDIPTELDQLCAAMLRRDPAARPSGREIRAALARGPGHVALPHDPSGDGELVGRYAEQRTLRAALEATRCGHSVTVFVHGPSGMGKTALVQSVLAGWRATHEAMVLAGRCHESESVPYKALDVLVDALSNQLIRLPEAQVTELLPRDIAELARLFPVLRRVDEVARELAHSPQPAGDPQESRQRAFAALRVLLRRLAERQRLVLFVDDLQWGDFDSAAFLLDLMHLADAPALLLIGCFRSEDLDENLLVRHLREPPGHGASAGDVRELALGPLPLEDATLLGRSALPPGEPDPEARAHEIACESGGSPLYVLELARADDPGAERGHASSLDSVLLDRIAALPAPAQALLTAVAVAGHPLPLAVAAVAAGQAVEPSTAHLLRVERLVRTRTVHGQPELEPYHDRVRVALLGQLDGAAQARVHGELARALEQRADVDPQLMVAHWRAAGDEGRAGAYALAAAARAEAALAFHLAAQHYQLALSLGHADPARTRELKARLAAALAYAGRLDESAHVSLEAAAGAGPDEALELRRRAMEALLLAGRLPEGLAIAREVAHSVGLRLPGAGGAAFAGQVWRKLHLRARGLGFAAREADAVAPAQLRRLDVGCSLATALTFVDPLLGMSVQSRQTLAALAAGEPYRASLALSSELTYRATLGATRWAELEPLCTRVRELAERTEDPQAIAFAVSATGLAYFYSGRWRVAHDLFRRAELLWRDRRIEMRWAADVTQAFLLATLVQLGETRELTHLLPIYLREAQGRGDFYATTALSTWRTNVGWLILDRAEEARQHAEEARLPPLGCRFHLHHYHELSTLAQIELYQGDGVAAWARLEASRHELEHSRLLHLPFLRGEAAYLRARAALAAAVARPGERRTLLDEAARAAASLGRERVPWAGALALLMEGSILATRGEPEAAGPTLAAAAARLEGVDMPLHAAVARRRRGELLGGVEGRAMATSATRWMEAQGVVHPARLTVLYAPGFAS
jgi:hypothetical protein